MCANEPEIEKEVIMASKRTRTVKRQEVRTSTAVTVPGRTIIETALRILKKSDVPLSPAEVAERGVKMDILRIPRGRTRNYLTQLIQSELYNNSEYAPCPIVYHVDTGQYEPWVK